LLSLLATGGEVVTVLGGIQGSPLPKVQGIPLENEHRWTRGSGDQSNSVVFVNDALMLKLFRRIEPAMNPEYEIGRFLSNKALHVRQRRWRNFDIRGPGPARDVVWRSNRSRTRAPAGISPSKKCGAITNGWRLETCHVRKAKHRHSWKR
jgi:hypothetical protein